MLRLFEREDDLATMMGLVRDEIAEKCRDMRLEAFDFAVGFETFLEQFFDGLARIAQRFLQELFVAGIFFLDFIKLVEQLRRGAFQPHEAHVVDIPRFEELFVVHVCSWCLFLT